MVLRQKKTSELPYAPVPDRSPAVIFKLTEDCIKGLQKTHPLHGDLEI